MTAHEGGKPRSRLARITASVLLLLSIGAIVLSLGAPGLGWAFASVILMIASLCTPWLGTRVVYPSLAVTAIHLVTFGPLTSSGGAHVSWMIGAILSWGPFLVCGVALLVPFWKRRFRRTDH